MPTLTIRNVPEGVHDALRKRAQAHARSVEAEVRALLAEAVGARGGVAEQSAAFDASRPPSAIGLWKDARYPDGRLMSEDFIASRRIEAAYEGEEVTPEEFADLNRRLDEFLIDLPWIEAFLEKRRRNVGG